MNAVATITIILVKKAFIDLIPQLKFLVPKSEFKFDPNLSKLCTSNV